MKKINYLCPMPFPPLPLTKQQEQGIKQHEEQFKKLCKEVQEEFQLKQINKLNSKRKTKNKS